VFHSGVKQMTEAQRTRALFVHTFAARLAPALRKRALQHPRPANPPGPCILKIDRGTENDGIVFAHAGAHMCKRNALNFCTSVILFLHRCVSQRCKKKLTEAQKNEGLFLHAVAHSCKNSTTIFCASVNFFFTPLWFTTVYKN